MERACTSPELPSIFAAMVLGQAQSATGGSSGPGSNYCLNNIDIQPFLFTLITIGVCKKMSGVQKRPKFWNPTLIPKNSISAFSRMSPGVELGAWLIRPYF